MKSILSAATLLFASLALTSCGNKEEVEAPAHSHAEVADGVAAVMIEISSGVSAIKDVETAQALAEKMPAIKQRMMGYHETAASLPTPTDEEKQVFKTKYLEAQEITSPVMMAVRMEMPKNPDAKEIGKILNSVMRDKEMQVAIEKIKAIYGMN